ncbi:matrix metalloproteinase [Striga asiatica]|uniref:Matrix metalloproteinase n=1 Tax=Striga asiatica TaxID=4170 RepID=A0A5A7R4R9_STRAF|nr:matrix metalloproteinase [Striga asiatica]
MARQPAGSATEEGEYDCAAVLLARAWRMSSDGGRVLEAEDRRLDASVVGEGNIREAYSPRLPDASNDCIIDEGSARLEQFAKTVGEVISLLSSLPPSSPTTSALPPPISTLTSLSSVHSILLQERREISRPRPPQNPTNLPSQILHLRRRLPRRQSRGRCRSAIALDPKKNTPKSKKKMMP